MHLRRLLTVLPLLPVLALGACGAADVSSQAPTDVIKTAFGSGKPIKSGRLDLRVALNGTSTLTGTSPLKVALTGPFSSTGGGRLPQFDFDLTLNLGGQAVPAGAVSTGGKAWLKLAGASFAVPDATYERFAELYAKDQRTAGAKQGQTFSALGVDPSRWLAAPKKAPDENVGGAETVHVTSKVAVPAFLADLNRLLGRTDVAGAAAASGAGAKVPTKLTAAQTAQIEQSVKSTSLDVYAGKRDGTLRRLNIQVAYDVPAAARAAAGGLTKGTLGLDLVITGLNEKQAITAPTSSRPLSDLTGGGGTTGTTGTTGATGGGLGTSAPETSTVPSAPSEQYRACLQKAAGDVAKAQDCAPLLNGR